MSAAILDSILNSSSPRIVSEQHNPNAINFVAGLADPGEMIRCGYLPEIRRQEGEQDDAYATRILPIVMALPKDQRDKIMGSAIQRASLDVSNGRISVMVAVGPNGEQMPWHRLGTMVAAAVNGSEALALANLGWKVLKVPAEREWNGKRVISTDTFLLVRDDTGAELGSVGKQYKTVQNDDATAFLDEALKDYGARYETAGAIYGGKSVWLQARLPKQIEVTKGDVVDGYATFTLFHDGTAACRCYPTTLRAVCANTLRLANEGKSKGISIRHTGDIKGKLNDARRALGLAVEGFESFGVAAQAMAATRMKVIPYANEVLDLVLDVTEAQAKMGSDVLAAAVAKTDAERQLAVKKFDAAIKVRDNLLSDILDRYESERCQKGTVWGGYNAISEAADHGTWRRYAGENKDSRRFESVLTGDADDLKQAAWGNAVAALAN